MKDNKELLGTRISCLKAIITISNKYKKGIKLNNELDKINSEQAWNLYVEESNNKATNWTSFKTFSELGKFILINDNCFLLNRKVINGIKKIDTYRNNISYSNMVDSLFNSRQLVLKLTNLNGKVSGLFCIKPAFKKVKVKNRKRKNSRVSSEARREDYLKSNKQTKLKIFNKVKSFKYKLFKLNDLHTYYNLSDTMKNIKENDVCFLTLDYASAFIIEAVVSTSNVIGCSSKLGLIYLLKTCTALSETSKIVILTNDYFDLESNISIVEEFPGKVEFIPLKYGKNLLEVFNEEGEYGVINAISSNLTIEDYMLHRYVNNKDSITSRAYYLCMISSYCIINAWKVSKNFEVLSVDKVFLNNKYLIEKFLSYSKYERKFLEQIIELLLKNSSGGNSSKEGIINKIRRVMFVSFVEIVEMMMRSKQINLDKRLVSKQLYLLSSKELKEHLTMLNKPEHSEAIESIITKDNKFTSIDYIDCLYLLSRSINKYYIKYRSDERIEINKFLQEFPIWKSLLDMVADNISHIEIKRKGIKKQFQMDLNNLILYGEIIICKKKLNEIKQLLYDELE